MPAGAVDQDVKLALEQYQLRSQYREPEIPDIIRNMAKDKQFYIFNVGPWEWKVSHGTTGHFTIPKCEEGKPYSKALVIDGVVFETYIVDSGVLASYQWDGKKLALETLGVGARRSPLESLIGFGCFLAEAKEPMARELKTANEALDRKCSELVAEARLAYQQNPIASAQTITDKHRWAAGRLKLGASEEKWLNEYSPQKEVQCWACFSNVNPRATICRTCQSSLNGEDGGQPPIKVK